MSAAVVAAADGDALALQVDVVGGEPRDLADAGPERELQQRGVALPPAEVPEHPARLVAFEDRLGFGLAPGSVSPAAHGLRRMRSSATAALNRAEASGRGRPQLRPTPTCGPN